jgi:hypothetical protein
VLLAHVLVVHGRSEAQVVHGVAAHVEAGPAGDQTRAQQEAGDRPGRAGRDLGAGGGVGQAQQPLGLVHLFAHHAVERLQGRAVGGGDGADRQGALDERVGPAAVEVEEADRLGRQQRGVGHEVAEGHALQQPQARQPEPQVARHAARPRVGRVAADGGHQLGREAHDGLGDQRGEHELGLQGTTHGSLRTSCGRCGSTAKAAKSAKAGQPDSRTVNREEREGRAGRTAGQPDG